MVKSGLVIYLIFVIFVNVTRFVILLYCCKCVLQAQVVSLKLAILTESTGIAFISNKHI